jgi:hypothetical protein
MTLDAYMDDFGRDLKRVVAKRRARRRVARLLLPAVPALAVAFAVIPRGADVDAVAAARAALAPNGSIVHMKLELDSGDRIVFPIEQWYAADPERWRTRTEGPGVVRGGETAYRNGRRRFYDARRDVVTIWRDPNGPGRASAGLIGGDPATDLRAELGKGGVRDDGVVAVDGREVRRLVRDSPRSEGLGRRLVYYVDPDTFEPVGGHFSLRRPGGQYSRGPSFNVTLYERLPFDERLLEFEKTPDTKYVWR